MSPNHLKISQVWWKRESGGTRTMRNTSRRQCLEDFGSMLWNFLTEPLDLHGFGLLGPMELIKHDIQKNSMTSTIKISIRLLQVTLNQSTGRWVGGRLWHRLLLHLWVDVHMHVHWWRRWWCSWSLRISAWRMLIWRWTWATCRWFGVKKCEWFFCDVRSFIFLWLALLGLNWIDWKINIKMPGTKFERNNLSSQ